MSDVPSNLIPTRITGLPEYLGTSTLGYLPYVIEGNTYKVQFANIAAVGAVPSTREINTGSGLGGGGDLSANRTLYILPEGVDDSRLTTTGVTAATYGAADSIPVFTVNAQGRVTGVTDTPIVLSNYVPTSRTITAGDGLSGGGNLSANRSFAVNFSSTTPEPLGPGSPGVSTVAAREDHVHPAVDLSDTTETQGVLPLSRGGTGNSLSPVVGAIAYSSNDKLYLTPTAGDAGQVLTSDGGTGAPYWQTITGTGTVTSVNASGGTTGLSFTGGPITSAGTLTLDGTLAVANGGTGASIAGTARTNLGAAASGANTDITSIALTTGTVSATPTNGTDIVNKVYADSIAAGINFHQSVRLATAAALPANTYNNGSSGVGATLTANANGALSVDGVAAVVGNRILVKNEVAQANNGVYTVTQVGSAGTPYILTRATDFDTSGAGVNKIDAGDFFLVTAGSTQTNTSWVQQTPLPIVVGTTALVFTQFAAPVLYSAGTGLTLAGTVFSITNTGVAASTYGSASSVPVIAVNAQGQVTSASSSSIAIAASQITSGTFTVSQGGTGATSLTSGYLLKGNGTSTVSASVVYDDGTNIGIGTSSPQDKLEAYGGNVRSTLVGASAATFRGFAMASDTTEFASLKAEASAGETRLTSGFTGFGGFTTFYTNGAERMRIDTSGNVGIGTSAITAIYGRTLQIGDGSTTSSISLIGSGAGTTGDGFIAAVASAFAVTARGGTALSLGSDDVERMRIDTSGNVLIGASAQAFAEKFRVYGNYSVFDNGTYTGFIGAGGSIGTGIATDFAFRSSNAMAFLTGGATERMRIDTIGNVLIGTTTAVEKLTIGSGSATAAGVNLRTTTTDFTISPSNSAAGGVTISTSWVSGGQGPLVLANAGGEIIRFDASRNVTLTNKIVPNVQSIASASTITPNANTDTQVSVTALAVPATIAAPSGTPSDGQSLVIRIEDNGTARALTWTTGSSGAYRAVGITLPTTTVAAKVMYIGFKYNSTDLRWDAIALSQEA